MDLNDREAVETLLGERARFSISTIAKGLVPSRVRRWAKATIVKGKRRHRRTLQDIEGIIVCPVCKKQVRWHDSLISCQSCGRIYSIKNGIPFLLGQ